MNSLGSDLVDVLIGTAITVVPSVGTYAVVAIRKVVSTQNQMMALLLGVKKSAFDPHPEPGLAVKVDGIVTEQKRVAVKVDNIVTEQKTVAVKVDGIVTEQKRVAVALAKSGIS
jgi:GMP synthase PP-ATPase subunit